MIRSSFALCLSVVVAAASLAAPSTGRAEEGVVVLRSSELAPYKAVEASFAAAIGQPVLSLSLAEPDARERFAKARAAAKLVLAIGLDAATLSAGSGPSGQGLVVALAPPVAASKLPAGAAIVPMFVPPARQAAAIKSVLPSAKSVGLLYDPAHSRALAGEYASAASTAGLSLVRAEVPDRAAVAEAVRSLVGKVDVLWLIPDPTVIAADSFKLLMQISLASKLPVAGFTAGMAKAGTILAVDASVEETGRRAAEAGKRLLDGKPGAADGCEGTLYLNATVAEMIGVALPEDAKGRAATVFK